MAEQSTEMAHQGPYVQAAAFCERVLREVDGVLSLIRIVDTVMHSPPAGLDVPLEMPEWRMNLTLVVMLKAGRARGRGEVAVTPMLPSQERMASMSFPIHLDADNRGHNVVADLDLPFRMEGVHWFLVTYNGQELTRVPLEVRYSPVRLG